MRSISASLALTVSLFALAVSVRAQPSQVVAVGARVRVTAPSALTPHRQEGSVIAVRGDSLVLQLQPRGESVPPFELLGPGQRRLVP